MSSVGVKIGLSVKATLLVLTILQAFPTTFAKTVSFKQPLNDYSFQDDPIELFELGQEAHEKGDLNRALELYRSAIKLKPEFPEAFFQIGSVLVSLGRASEAEDPYRHAIELRDDWVLPQVALGSLLIRLNRTTEAEKLFESVLEKEPQNITALSGLARLNLQFGQAAKATVAIELFKRALDAGGNTQQNTQQDKRALYTLLSDLARAEIIIGDKAGALGAITRAISIDPSNPEALITRAEIYLTQGDEEKALADLEAVRKSPALNGNKELSLQLARLLARAGRSAEALAVLDSIGESVKNGSDVLALRAELLMSDAAEELSSEQIATLERLLPTTPRNAQLLARLGAAYRKKDPVKSSNYFAQANQIEPSNATYATGYAAALVQAHRFEEAVVILQRVLTIQPDFYTAHTNLATALYELKRYPEAIIQYQWIAKAQPNLAITSYLIGIAHDKAGELEDALASYEAFLAHADIKQNQLEIEKVNLRLPSLRNQIRRGEGVNRKRSSDKSRVALLTRKSGQVGRWTREEVESWTDIFFTTIGIQ